MNRLTLSEKIKDFLKKYAKSKSDDNYNSPDAHAMSACAQALAMEDYPLDKIRPPFSEYSQGGYITSEDGSLIHDSIFEDLDKLKKFNCPNCEKEVSISHNFCGHCRHPLKD